MLQCSLFVEKDSADDENKLNTEVSLQNLEGILGNFARTGHSSKKEDKM